MGGAHSAADDSISMSQTQGCSISDSGDQEAKTSIKVAQSTDINAAGDITIGGYKGEDMSGFNKPCPNGVHALLAVANNTATVKSTSKLTTKNISKQSCVNSATAKAQQKATATVKGLFPSGTSDANASTSLAVRNETVMTHYLYSSVSETVDLRQQTKANTKKDFSALALPCTKVLAFNNTADISTNVESVVNSNLQADAVQSTSADFKQTTSATVSGLSFGFMELLAALLIFLVMCCVVFMYPFLKLLQFFTGAPAKIASAAGMLGVIVIMLVIYALLIWPGAPFLPNVAKADDWWPIGKKYDVGALAAASIFAMLTQIANVTMIMTFSKHKHSARADGHNI